MASILEAGGHVDLQVHISRGASLLWLVPTVWASRGEAKSSPRADSATMQNKTQLREAVKSENASMYTWRAARKPTLLHGWTADRAHCRMAGCGTLAGCWQRPSKRRTSNVLPSTITSAPWPRQLCSSLHAGQPCFAVPHTSWLAAGLLLDAGSA